MSNPLQKPLFLFGKPNSKGFIKKSNKDFFVKEFLPFELSGEGEHEWIFVEKNGLNTQDLIILLANKTNTAIKDIGYSGLKDKYAITQQWLSFYRPGKENIKWDNIKLSNIKIIEHGRHNKKLKIGTHQHNYFKLKIHFSTLDKDDLLGRLKKIQNKGFANYFGQQRFGNKCQNIVNANKWLSKGHKISRAKKSLYISVLRSDFFNQALSNRLNGGLNFTPQPNDCFMLSGSNSYFKYEKNQLESNKTRLKSKDITICHNLLGENIKSDYNEFEISLINESFGDVLYKLIDFGVKSSKRSITAFPINLNFQFINQNMLQLSFGLEKGQYATSLIRELVCIDN